MAAPPQLCGT